MSEFTGTQYIVIFGKLCFIDTYKNGKLDGPSIYYENGRPISECTYKNGKLDGPYRTWYPSGEIKTEGVNQH